MGNAKSCCVYGSAATPRHQRDDAFGRPSKNKRRSNGHYGGPGGGGVNADGILDYASGPGEYNGVSSHPGHGVSGGSGQFGQQSHEESCGNLQHISEREPDDWETDPSLHPTTETLFMEKSKQSIQSKQISIIFLNLEL